MTKDKIKKMQEISERVHEEVKSRLDEFMDKSIFELSELLDFEYDMKDFIISEYKTLFEEEEASELDIYIDVILKVDLMNGYIGIHPGNLVTALLFNCYYNFDIPIEKYSTMMTFMNNVGKMMHYDREKSALLSIQTH